MLACASSLVVPAFPSRPICLGSLRQVFESKLLEDSRPVDNPLGSHSAGGILFWELVEFALGSMNEHEDMSSSSAFRSNQDDSVRVCLTRICTNDGRERAREVRLLQKHGSNWKALGLVHVCQEQPGARFVRLEWMGSTVLYQARPWSSSDGDLGEPCWGQFFVQAHYANPSKEVSHTCMGRAHDKPFAVDFPELDEACVFEEY